jgi:uncharacterized protein YecE (DUF72 family)
MYTHYSNFFSTVEINSTFYRYPSEALIFGLVRSAPKGFIFSTKLPKLITHEKRLNLDLKVENDLIRFLELFDPLKKSGKLGCILIQLPPSFTFYNEKEKLISFLSILPEDYDFSVEFRHLSWMRDDTWEILHRENIAYCNVDEPLLPPEVHLTSNFSYFRWHGKGKRLWYNYHYNKNELKDWVPKIEKAKDKTEKIYGYFNNHFHGYAVENCIEILEMLKKSKPEHEKIKQKIKNYNLQKKTYKTNLEDFGFKTPT